MKVLFYLHHPSQFHLFKNTIVALKKNNEVLVVATKKDILLDLLDKSNFEYVNILPEGRNNNLFSIGLGLIKQDFRLLKLCMKFKPDLLVGTSTEITHIGRLLGKKSLFFIEDDIQFAPILNYLAHPFASKVVSPKVCSLGKWEYKGIKYDGYQKLAYLHPSIFQPQPSIVEKYGINPQKPFFIIRLTNLGAHHDVGAKGISDVFLDKLIEFLSSKGDVFLTSEKKLNSKYDSLILKINPIDIHHILYYAGLFLGDSQSMAVESSLLGTPNIRISSFAGTVSVLEELEKKYELTTAFQPEQQAEILGAIENIISNKEAKSDLLEKRDKMLLDKINVNHFIYWLISEFPKSLEILKDNPNHINSF
jgi:predicted glycosyltransferase